MNGRANEPHFLQRFGLTRDFLDANDMRESNCLSVLVSRVFSPDEDAYLGMVDKMEPFQSKIRLAIATHLRSAMTQYISWTLKVGLLLSSNAQLAATAAKGLLKRLQTTKQLEPLETCILNDRNLMSQLELFVSRPGKTLWQHGNDCAELFRYLATRFLTAPDHVLDCEGVHAQWQWLMTTKRGMKLKLMNGILRMRQLVRAGALPDAADLAPHMDDYARELRTSVKDAQAAGTGAGQQLDSIYAARCLSLKKQKCYPCTRKKF